MFTDDTSGHQLTTFFTAHRLIITIFFMFHHLLSYSFKFTTVMFAFDLNYKQDFYVFKQTLLGMLSDFLIGC